MGRSAKKKTNANHTKRIIEFETALQFDETAAEITHYLIDGFSRLAHSDPEKKSIMWKATIESPSTSFVEKEDYLWRFFTLLEDNRAELEQVIAKKKQFSFNDRRVTVRNKSSEILVKSMIVDHPMLTTSSLMPDTFFSNLFTTAFMNQEPAFNLVFSMLNDRVYQIFNECSARVDTTLERVELELKNPDELKVKIEANNSLDSSFFLETVIRASAALINEIIHFTKDLPGLNKLNQNDFVKITESKVIDYYYIVNSVLFINGESYYYITDSLIYTRFWMNTIRPQPAVDKLFEFAELLVSLRLTKREKALLLAQVLTQPGLFNQKRRTTDIVLYIY
jgi:hypothetical protein